jgi:hypothetical protein
MWRMGCGEWDAENGMRRMGKGALGDASERSGSNQTLGTRQVMSQRAERGHLCSA